VLHSGVKGVYTLNVKSIYYRILIAFDKELLKRIDRERKLQKLDRTKFIRKAVKAYVVSEEFRRASGEHNDQD
jgi:metal-responsive CopG/Arc/MetJ family transcriptional regulator